MFRRTKLDDIILKDKHTKTMGFMVLLLAVLILVEGFDFLVPERVTVVQRTFEGETQTDVLTRARTVDALLEELSVDVPSEESVRPVGGTKIYDGMKITVTESIPSKATIAGKTVDFLLMPGTVAENLQANGVSFDDDDIIKPAVSEAVTPESRIEVKDVRRTVEEKQEKVEAKDIVILDPEMSSGEIEETEGVDGEAIYAYTTTYINGKENGTAKEVKQWIKKPTDHTLRFGTSLTGESGETTYTETFMSETTAYYFGDNAHGSTGGLCHYGTCAVDPSVIPYGTTLFVEDYGIAVANDTGGAIVGTDVDLYMHSTEEAVRWGRYNTRVYVLDY